MLSGLATSHAQVRTSASREIANVSAQRNRRRGTHVHYRSRAAIFASGRALTRCDRRSRLGASVWAFASGHLGTRTEPIRGCLSPIMKKWTALSACPTMKPHASPLQAIPARHPTTLFALLLWSDECWNGWAGRAAICRHCAPNGAVRRLDHTALMG